MPYRLNTEVHLILNCRELMFIVYYNYEKLLFPELECMF
jgi:hypothetical protein